MSFQAMAWAIEQRTAGSKEKFVLLMLANYASNETGECFPSLKTLAEATMLSKHTVIRALKSLEAGGFLAIRNRRLGSASLANSYRLNLQGVVAPSDQGSRTENPGVVASCDPNLSEEPVNEPVRATARERKRYADPVVILQSHVDSMTARRFAEHCAQKGRPLSAPGAEAIGAVLAEVTRRGGSAVEALSMAISRNWSSLQFEWLVNAGLKFEAMQQRQRRLSDDDWRRVLADFCQTGYWPEIALGTPPPGEPGCTVPEHLLKETETAGGSSPSVPPKTEDNS